jgi:hypothetical protein
MQTLEQYYNNSDQDVNFSDESFNNIPFNYIHFINNYDDYVLADFSNCGFFNCNFSNSNLEEVDFIKCSFNNCTFSDCSLSGVYFLQCYFSPTNKNYFINGLWGDDENEEVLGATFEDTSTNRSNNQCGTIYTQNYNWPIGYVTITNPTNWMINQWKQLPDIHKFTSSNDVVKFDNFDSNTFFLDEPPPPPPPRKECDVFNEQLNIVIQQYSNNGPPWTRSYSFMNNKAPQNHISHCFTKNLSEQEKLMNKKKYLLNTKNNSNNNAAQLTKKQQYARLARGYKNICPL